MGTLIEEGQKGWEDRLDIVFVWGSGSLEGGTAVALRMGSSAYVPAVAGLRARWRGPPQLLSYGHPVTIHS